MSFSGKKWKRVQVENAIEFMEAVKASDKLQDFLKQKDTVYSYTKNDDGTFVHTIEAGGEVVREKKFTLGEEFETTLPDGEVMKNKYTLEGDTLTENLKDSDGRSVYLERTFSGDTMKMKISADGVDVVAHVEYKAV